MLSGSLTPCTATLLASSRLKSASITSDEYNALLPPSAATSEKSTPSSRHSITYHALNSAHHQQQAINGCYQLHPDAVNGAATAPSTGAAAAGGPAPPVAATNSAGRSAALERAYVHDVYEHCEEPAGTVRPRVAQFLAGLEPGSMVCDVGCGNGRYLNANPLCFTLGVDRCARLANGVRADGGGEVALCDNLELPFRDESFDAVLSVAVVHHFATTERRVGAIRELARVLRIGGRVIITVWALEQKQRRFESQDVLIPWQQPKSRNSNFSDEDDDDDFLPPYHAYTEDSTNSSRSAGDGDSSSLSSSSPGESCYSFVRRAIQKLAGTGRRHPWFLDTWTSKDTKNGSSLDYEDAKDLPIELRRLEDFEDFPGAGGTAGSDTPLTAGLKSRSLGSILYPPPVSSRQIVRSRSSVPSLGGAHIPENVIVQCSNNASQQQTGGNYAASLHHHHGSPLHGSSTGATTITTTATTMMVTPCVASVVDSAAVSAASKRPRLVKQKQSLCDDDQSAAANADPTASTAAIDSPSANKDTRMLLRKQSSLNEELMAENRIRERERVKKRIQKQTSLNESHLTRSAVFSRKFQVMRDGLTTKLKSGTGSLERVTKSGLVKILQTVKSSSAQHCAVHTTAEQHQQTSSIVTGNGSAFGHIKVPWGIVRQSSQPAVPGTPPPCMNTSTTTIGSNGSSSVDASDDPKERRHSRESGSDSSKDSLQSDTSIESEDSFASVIFIPKSDGQQQIGSSNADFIHSTVAACLFTRTPSVPTSPLVMPCPTPAHSPAPPRCKHPAAGTQLLQPEQTRFPFENLLMQKSDANVEMANIVSRSPSTTTMTNPHGSMPTTLGPLSSHSRPSLQQCTSNNNHIAPLSNRQPHKQQSFDAVASKPTTSIVTSTAAATNKISPKAERITRQVVKNLPQIPKFRRHASINYPIVRRANSNVPTVPKLSSMELFNPATDDLDSDSSEPSSPDSIDSVISAFKPPVSTTTTATTSASSEGSGKATASITPEPASVAALNASESNENAVSVGNTLDVSMLMPKSDSLRAKDAYSLTSDVTIAGPIRMDNASNPQKADNEQNNIHSSHIACDAPPPVSRKELVAFAEQLSAQLLKEMGNSREAPSILEEPDESYDANENSVPKATNTAARFRQEDPYIRKLNGELKDLHSLREELRERRLMLANLNIAQYQNSSTIQEEDESPRADCEDELPLPQQQPAGNAIATTVMTRPPSKPEPQRVSSIDAASSQDDIASMINSTDNLSVWNAVIDGHGGSPMSLTSQQQQQRQSSAHPPPMESRPSVESWAHSNSTASLDSPSAGGSSTHHRYYHVFREGELDALINHHVTSLHIVSSYYERASWCVVAEKVQVWSI